jgi:hypothetical protein
MNDKTAPEYLANLDQAKALQRARERAAGVNAPVEPNLAEGFDGSSVRAGPNHSTIEIWYDTHDQAVAAHKFFNDLVDAAGVTPTHETKEVPRG